ncbi:MAG: hypothetical protein WAT71_12345 [Ignavibacteria bacterium]
MGYYTRLYLDLETYPNETVSPVLTETIISEFIAAYPEAGYDQALTPTGDFLASIKINPNSDCIKELKTFSLKYPDILFTLNGQGEEFEDAWKIYALNGKTQLAYSRIPEFNPLKAI